MIFESLTNETKDVDRVFRKFLEKYALTAPNEWRIRPFGARTPVESGAVALTDARNLTDVDEERADVVPLFPWRFARRFVELAKLVATETVEDVVMCRFACSTPRSTELAAILYREFDLLERLNGSPIASLYAAIADGRLANVVAKLENGCVCSVEASATFADESAPVVDRHELIGRRGVASDRVVDAQLPQSSVYLFQPGAASSWTDTDAEFFGLGADEIDALRAAADFAVRASSDVAAATAEQWKEFRRLRELVARTLESDRTERNDAQGGRR